MRFLRPVGASGWAAVAAVAAAAWPQACRAACAHASVVIAPDRDQVPVDPTLFVFAPARRVSLDRSRVDVIGADMIERTVEPSGSAIAVLRVRLSASAGTRVVVSVTPAVEPRWAERYGGVARVVLDVDGAWRRPGGSTLALSEVSRRKYEWTCSGNDTIDAVPSIAAPAYRVRVAATRQDVARGRGQAFVVPWSISSLFHAAGDDRTHPLVSLGSADCVGSTLPGDMAPSDVRYFGVDALLPDGSVVPSAHVVDVARVPLDATDASEGAPSETDPASRTGSVGSPHFPRRSLALGAAGLALAGAFSLAWSRRRRGRGRGA